MLLASPLYSITKKGLLPSWAFTLPGRSSELLASACTIHSKKRKKKPHKTKGSQTFSSNWWPDRGVRRDPNKRARDGKRENSDCTPRLPRGREEPAGGDGSSAMAATLPTWSSSLRFPKGYSIGYWSRKTLLQNGGLCGQITFKKHNILHLLAGEK